MAPYAFHPGWTAPRRSVHDRISRPVRDRLSYNRSYKKSSNYGDKKEWRPKSPCAEISMSGKQQEDNSNAIVIVVGAHELKLKEPVVDDKQANSGGPVLIIQPKSSANDHEASTSRAKPRDPKYTQPKWCPLGLTKTKKRRLQRMRNQE